MQADSWPVKALNLYILVAVVYKRTVPGTTFADLFTVWFMDFHLQPSVFKTKSKFWGRHNV